MSGHKNLEEASDLVELYAELVRLAYPLPPGVQIRVHLDDDAPLSELSIVNIHEHVFFTVHDGDGKTLPYT